MGALTTTAIIAEYKAYYLNSGQNLSRLKMLLRFGMETDKICTPIVTDDTIYQMGLVKTKSLVQSFQKAWTPKGEMVFTPNKIELHKLKVDLDVYPDDIEASWLGFLAANSLTRKEWPLIRFIMESYLFGQINDDMERNEIYKGVYAAPTENEAGLDGKSMNGFKYMLQHTGVNHDTTVGALDKATVYDQYEKAFELVLEEYQQTDMVIACSPSWKRSFLKDKRSLGYYTIQGPGQIDDSLDFSPARVVGLPSMAGTNDWFITPQSNLLSISKKGENANKIDVQESKRCVSFLTDWYKGVGLGMSEICWTNVAAAE